MFLGERSVFSYCICKRELLECEAVKVRVGEYHVYTNRNTHFDYREDPDVSLFVIGIAACLNGGESALDWLWKHKQSITSIVEAEKYLGGKYVLFIRIKDSYFILGDATCSIPVFYAKCDDGAICSSIGYQIAEEQGLSVDSVLLEIREGGDSSRTMPYDYTIWKGIKRLLPNHYLDVNRMCVIRMVNQPVLLSPQSAEQAAEISLPFIKRLAEYYMRKFSVACALTSGRDSRAVLSVLGCSKDIPIYTMKHNEFAENTPDIVVPKQIAARVNLDYHQINDVDFKIYQLFVALAAELKIPAMRSHQRIYVPASNPNDKLPLVWRIIEPFKSRLIDHWQHQAHRKGMSSPEGLIVTICPKDMNNIDYVFKNIKWGKHQVGEFVIHPATCNDSPFFGKIVDQRIVEYKLFSAENTLKEIKSCGIELVNYSVL